MNEKAAETVRSKWNETMRKRIEEKPLIFAWQSETVSKFYSENYLNGYDVHDYLKHLLNGKKIKRALDLGGGLGNHSIHLYHLLEVEKFDVLDLSDYSVEKGNERARAENLNVEFRVANLNTEELPADEYDLVYASGALHHIERLEHLFEQINRTLKADGLFFANDYMGPNQMQWTDTQLQIMNRLLEAFPDQYLRVSSMDNQIVRQISRIPLEIFEKFDPSEGVRASEIFDVAQEYLNIEKIVPQCLTINYELLRGRIHNFDPNSEADNFVLRLLCTFEKILFENHVIGSDGNVLVGSKKES